MQSQDEIGHEWKLRKGQWMVTFQDDAGNTKYAQEVHKLVKENAAKWPHFFMTVIKLV